MESYGRPPPILNSQSIGDEPEVNPEGFFNDLTTTNACSVRVAVRVRPLINRELNEGPGGRRTCVDVSGNDQKLQIGEKQFQFDRVFSSDSEQREIFDVCSRNLVLGCFAGYNATILAYGQTGSGKTHTMGTGSTNGLDDETIGIVPRVFKFIFEELDRKKKQYSMSEFTIKISFLELYNEELHDLLEMQGKATKELLIKEKNGTIYILGLKEEIVNSKEQCLELLNKGIAQRTTSATLMNEGSSRSHAIFTISIEQKIVKEIDEGIPVDSATGLPGQTEEQITAKFHFVDLAGSERIKKTGATGQLLKEGISINKGLLCLGNVISALTDESKKEKHIPYRDSKLTRILQDSLGGNSRTTMIACVSPAESNYEESLNSIKYASRARNIKNKAVVNRDPNSLLIDSLRQQIQKLQGEIIEYKKILKDNGVAVPDNFSESVSKRINEDQKGGPSRQSTFQGDSGTNQNEAKVKLYHMSNQMKNLEDERLNLLDKMTQREIELSDLQKERNDLRVRNEILNEHLQRNGIQVEDQPQSQTLSLIEEYTQKVDRMQREIEKQKQEMQVQSLKIGQLQAEKQRDEQILSQKMEDNNKLKRQLKKYEEGGAAPNLSPMSAQKGKIDNRLRLNLQGITNSTPKQMPIGSEKKLNVAIDAEGLNKKIIDSLSMQLDSIFSASNLEALDSEPKSAFKSPRRSRTPAPQDPFSNPHAQSSDDELLTAGDAQELEDSIASGNTQVLEDREKILNSVKNSVQQLQSELVVMMEQKYEEKISTIEKDLRQVENDKQATLKKTTDTKQQQAIEQQYKQKMDDLARQLQMYKEKEKQQEQVAKQIVQRESKIKNLEDDINKIRRSKDTMEKQMKSDTEKFTKFKQNISKELTNAIKVKSEKEKEVIKLKHDLKKTDQIAQQKISELRGMQKKIYEDRVRKDLEKQEEHDKKGIDIDRIKQWITDNTDRMMLHQELKDAMDKHNDEKKRIEDEMFEEGEKLNAFMLDKERKELDKQALELQVEENPLAEGRIIELEEDIYQLTLQLQNITETLESLEETYEFHTRKLNQFNEEAIALSVENIEPIKFIGLQSVDQARVTLQTFFSVMLDLNIYKRDLELKCIDSDARLIEMEADMHNLERRMEELSTRGSSNQGSNMLAIDGKQAQQQANKEDAIKKIVNNMEGFVDNRELKGLNLTPNEQNSLTKLSLSKIVTNMKSQLEEEKKKNHNLCLKLEQAIKDKEAFKLKFENLKKKATDDAIALDPKQYQALQQQSQSVPPTSTATEKAPMNNLAQARANRRQNPSAKMEDTVKKTTKPEVVAEPPRVNRLAPSATKVAPAKKPLANKKSSRSQSREEEDDAKPKVPNFMKGTKSSTSNPPVSLQQRRQAAKQKQQDEQPQTTQQPEVPSVSKPVPSLRDRRNQRKLGHAEDALKTDIFTSEIDRIKEETMMITSNQSHDERKQARAREFSSKRMANERAMSSGSQQRQTATKYGVDGAGKLGEIRDNGDEEESPTRIVEEDDQYGQEEYTASAPQAVQPQEAQYIGQNRWSHEELAFIENFGQSLIGCEIFDGKIILVFQDFTVREILLNSMEESQTKNILALNGMSHLTDPALDFTIDKEIGAIAITTSQFVYIFDQAYSYQSHIELANIEKIVFCQINIILQVKDGDGYVFIAYQITDCQELGMYECQSEGFPVEMRSDNNYLYLAYGNRLVKLNVPDFQVIFDVETEHQDLIIDFSLSPQTIVTTSSDKSLKVHSINTGEQIVNSMDDIECDHVETCEDYILSRCYDGNSIVVFRCYDGQDDLAYNEDLDLSEIREQMGTIQEFKMKGKIVTKLSSAPGAPSYDIVLLVSVLQDGILVNALKHKPLSEN